MIIGSGRLRTIKYLIMMKSNLHEDWPYIYIQMVTKKWLDYK